MKLSAIIMVAAITGLLTSGSPFAAAKAILTIGSPIQVLNFQYSPNSPDNEVGQPQEGLMLTFKNVASKPARDVVFAVRDASGFQLGTVSRHGTFSPGVDVTRYFGVVKMKHKHGNPAKANAIQVTFVDGSQWEATK